MQAGLMNTYRHPISSRQTVAWFLSGLLTLSYLLLYLGPIPALGVRWDVFQAGAEAVGLKSKWTLYGLLYTLAMIAGGAYVIRRHGSSRYQLIRTSVVVLVQITFGFALAQFIFLYNLFSTLKSGAPAAQKQWEGADSIDWTHLPTPPPYHSFETPPVLK